jgi:peptidoglycan/xylan/chitin deacetylase (PgdA/CDA1 family)
MNTQTALNNVIIFRMDDVGAASKKWEVYGKGYLDCVFFKLRLPLVTNFLFMKYLPMFKSWGPYDELTAGQWTEILDILRESDSSMTVGITAGWVEKDGTIIPFPEKFPEQAKVIRQGLREGLLDIANHGLTHCVVGKHLPRWFSSNRTYHREFWSWIPFDTQREHIERSQKILTDFFGAEIRTFIPPGNIWTDDTEKFAFKNELRYLSSDQRITPDGKKSNGITYVSNNVFTFHDREPSLHGTEWFKKTIKGFTKKNYQIHSIKTYLDRKNI